MKTRQHNIRLPADKDLGATPSARVLSYIELVEKAPDLRDCARAIEGRLVAGGVTRRHGKPVGSKSGPLLRGECPHCHRSISGVVAAVIWPRTSITLRRHMIDGARCLGAGAIVYAHE